MGNERENKQECRREQMMSRLEVDKGYLRMWDKNEIISQEEHSEQMNEAILKISSAITGEAQCLVKQLVSEASTNDEVSKDKSCFAQYPGLQSRTSKQRINFVFILRSVVDTISTLSLVRFDTKADQRATEKQIQKRTLSAILYFTSIFSGRIIIPTCNLEGCKNTFCWLH